MNTQEKELKHCTACNQMTNHSGETCLKHTPDIEWERIEKYLVTPTSKRVVKEFIASRDTYWKERVRKEVEGIKEKYSRRELQQGGYSQACDDILQVLDNLK